MIGRGDDERGAWQDPQNLRHALASLEEGDAAGTKMSVTGEAISRRGEIGVVLGCSQRAADRLNRDDEVDQVFDRRLVLAETHRMGQGECQTQGELRLRQPAVEVVPAQPARDRLGRRIDEEHPLPRDEHVVEPHLAVELVITAAERGDKRVRVAGRDLAAQDGDARGIDRHDKARRVPANLQARQGADIDVLDIGRARMHPQPAADDHPGIGLADELQRDALLRVGMHALADDRGAAAIGQKAPGAGDPPAISFGLGDLLIRGVVRLGRGQNAELDQVAVGRGVGDVAGA